MTMESTPYIIGAYRKTYFDIWKTRLKSLSTTSWDMRQIELLDGFCALTGKNFNFAYDNIAEPMNTAIEKYRAALEAAEREISK